VSRDFLNEQKFQVVLFGVYREFYANGSRRYPILSQAILSVLTARILDLLENECFL